MKKIDLVEKIKMHFGYPIVKVELEDKQIINHIDRARNKYVKWAIGNSTQERYCTVMLSAGQDEYDMPSDCVNVVSYSKKASSSINTLFTIENYLFNMGMYAPLSESAGANGYTLVSYHIARDFLETVSRYDVDEYNWTYHKHTNKLEINPKPASGNSLSWTSGGVCYGPYDSPGFVLIKMYAVEGEDTDLYESGWILEYATALSKKTLGLIRRKFASFGSIGNTGLSLDGSELVSEADSELERLSEFLKNDEVFEGGWILIG